MGDCSDAFVGVFERGEQRLERLVRGHVVKHAQGSATLLRGAARHPDARTLKTLSSFETVAAGLRLICGASSEPRTRSGG